ncbi:MAG: hypothetical protein K2J08_03310 [Ruminococcus sp.]|nr:hypothetical protein [Ruminococcus sp.]
MRSSINLKTILKADTGYQGITGLHTHFVLPKKKSKNHQLTKDEKQANREILKERIFVEYAIQFVRRFRILSERYRNRRKRFVLRFSLLAGICNFDMSV